VLEIARGRPDLRRCTVSFSKLSVSFSDRYASLNYVCGLWGVWSLHQTTNQALTQIMETHEMNQTVRGKAERASSVFSGLNTLTTSLEHLPLGETDHPATVLPARLLDEITEALIRR